MIRQHDSTVMIRPRGYQAHRSNRKIMKVLHEDLRWRVIYHQYLYGSSIKETANVLFTSTAFVSKIRRLYRQRGEVNRKRRTGRQRILSCNASVNSSSAHPPPGNSGAFSHTFHPGGRALAFHPITPGHLTIPHSFTLQHCRLF